MPFADSTCWHLIRGAAAGLAGDRDRYTARYLPVVRAYLAARWRGTPHLQELDDAVQEVFVACFDGALAAAEGDRPGGFRPYLYGVARNIARRVEVRAARRREHQPPSDAGIDQHPADDERLSVVFDRAWADALVREAARRQAERAAEAGPEPVRRVELLRLRFEEGLPVREIARRWQADPADLHHEYAKARREFLAALREVMAFHQPGPPEAVDRACVDLLQLLG